MTPSPSDPDPPPIPELLTKPVVRPESMTPRRSNLGSQMAGMGKAWGTAIDFMVTIFAGALVGWLIARYAPNQSPHQALWVLGGLALGFTVALIRIIKAAGKQ